MLYFLTFLIYLVDIKLKVTDKGAYVMQKIIVPISKCIPGMITSGPIIDLKTGTTIVGQNQELTPEHIKNIQNFVHTDIWVYLDSFNKVWNLPVETIENYKKYSSALMAVVNQMDQKDTSLLDISDFEALCQDLPTDFTANYSLLGCTNLIEQLDCNTYNHSLNVAFISMLICRWCNLDNHLIASAIKAGLLHDIGLLNLSFDPFDPSFTRNADEQAEYEKHPIYSYNLVSKLKDLDPIIPKAILAHHEHCDGSGFPVHISSPYINLLGKILGLADTYDLLRHKHHIFDTLKILLLDLLPQFDPKLLLTFCTNIATYYVGTFVILNTGEIGEVVFVNPQCLYRPIIKINDRFINLYEHNQIDIIAIK